MSVRIQPYSPDLAGGVFEFNSRLRAAGIRRPMGLPAEPDRPALPKESGLPFHQECWLAVEGDAVRGGYTLYHQLFSFQGYSVPVATFVMPVSEGIIDRQYNTVGAQLLLDAVRRQPLLFGYGMQGKDGPMTKLAKVMKWDIRPIPFYFRIVDGTSFLRNIQMLRGSRWGALLADLAAAAQLGRLAGMMTNTLLTRKNASSVQVEAVDQFCSWADEIWDASRQQYSVLSIRNRQILNALYGGRPEFKRLKISKQDRAIGWAVVEINDANPRRFGQMRVGYLVDCLSQPADVEAVTQATAKRLAADGVDLIVSNENHPAWEMALRRSGFLPGPSTFVFASAPCLTRLIEKVDPLRRAMHLMRGAGDAPLVNTYQDPQPGHRSS